jgi:hypothetical protein
MFALLQFKFIAFVLNPLFGEGLGAGLALQDSPEAID